MIRIVEKHVRFSLCVDEIAVFHDAEVINRVRLFASEDTGEVR